MYIIRRIVAISKILKLNGCKKRKGKEIMTEKEKVQNGFMYNQNYDAELIQERTNAQDICFAYN